MKKQQKGLTLIELMIVVAIIAILAGWAIPKLQNYIVRTQVSRVMSETGQYITAYEDCINSGRTEKVSSNVSSSTKLKANECAFNMVASNLVVGKKQNKGSKAPKGTGYPQVKIKKDGSGSITATFGNSASTSISKKKLAWKRDKQGSWLCETDVPSQYKPVGCED